MSYLSLGGTRRVDDWRYSDCKSHLSLGGTRGVSEGLGDVSLVRTRTFSWCYECLNDGVFVGSDDSISIGSRWVVVFNVIKSTCGTIAFTTMT